MSIPASTSTIALAEPATTPELIHLQTLKSPTGITRAWSSQSHPSSRTPLLATASSDKSVQVWDLRDYKLVSTINGGHKRSVRCVGWKDWGEDTTKVTPRKQKPVTLATGSFDSNVGVWVYDPLVSSEHGGNGGNARLQSSSEIDVGDELDMTVRPDKDVDDDDGPRRDNDDEWNFTTLLTGPDSEIKDLQFSPPHYGANLLATCSRDKSVWIWEEVEDDNEWETIAVLTEHTGDVKCVGWCSGASIPADDASTENEIVGSREILATGSYDDTIRLWRDVEEEGDWTCVAVLEAHKGTVWDLCWEGYLNTKVLSDSTSVREWEPRIVSCSDDITVKTWRRQLSESEKLKKLERLENGVNGSKQDRLPSIIRPTATVERWTEEATLPQVHVRSIYAVDWSKHTGLIVSCGGDGTIVVYKEILAIAAAAAAVDEDVVMNGSAEQQQQQNTNGNENLHKETNWTVVAVIECAHDEYEVNHVCWAPRRDKNKRWDGEEVIVSTGDDGDVKLWCLPDGIFNEDEIRQY